MKKSNLSKLTKQNGALGKRYQGAAVASLVFAVVLILIASYAVTQLMEKQAHDSAEKLVTTVVEHVDTKIEEVELLTEDAAKTANMDINNPDALEQQVRDFVEANDSVYGSTIAFEPNVFPDKGRCFAPYSWITPDGEVHSRQLGTETDYYQEEWYAETKKSGETYWCEPYFDEGGAKVMMCTFSVPLKDSEGKLVAVMTSDVGLEELDEYVKTINPTDESSITLRSMKGVTLADSGQKNATGKDNVVIKGETRTGWVAELTVPFTYLLHGDSGVFIYIGVIFLIIILMIYFINRFLTKLQQRSSAEYINVIDAISSNFTSIFLVDLITNELFAFRELEGIASIGDTAITGARFTARLKELIEHDGHQQDQAMMIREGSLETIRENLAIQDRYEVRFRKVKEDGKISWHEMNVFVMERDEDGAPTRAVIAFTDVNESVQKEKEAQDTLEQALGMAQSANLAKSSFLFNMSHDIRTPMNAITGFTTMAKKYADDPERLKDYLSKIEISSSQLLTLVNQVLEMSRIEAGKTDFNMAPIDVKERFDAMVTVISEQAKSNGLTFRHSLNNVTHNHILADDARMGQITYNIVGNAIKYTPDGGSVDFELTEVPCDREGYARFTFTVADTGIGMSKEFLEEIFQPFTREKTSTVSKIQGTGLGMSIVKNVVDLMGGTIDIQSEPGKGTRFDITVDFEIDKDRDAKADQTETKKVDVEAFRGKRALLVEDNEMNREIARDILEEYGFEIEEAEDGDIAVEMVKKTIDRGEATYYDFVLMDVQMPRMDGYEATREIRAIPISDGTHIPIIAMTANAFEEDRQNALKAGMDEHLAKPIDVMKLFETLGRFI